MCYTSGGNNTHRGGCAVLVRNALGSDISISDNTHEDLITFQLKSLPNIHFMCWYLPPKDSPYFTLDNLANISAIISSNVGDKFVT